MVVRGRLKTGAFAFALLAASASCKRKQEPPPPAPLDHLAKGEVVEGKENAFGLPLPRTSKIDIRFDKSVRVSSPMSPEELANFVRARVKEGKVTAGTSSTHLEDVVAIADPKRRLTIDVRPSRFVDTMHSEMIVVDSTPPPIDPKLTNDEQRWNSAGLSPDGTILDPKHLH